MEPQRGAKAQRPRWGMAQNMISLVTEGFEEGFYPPKPEKFEEDFLYLASPYSHKEDSIKESRYEAAMAGAAFLYNQGFQVFSPIAHCHVIAKTHDLPGHYAFWQRMDHTMIQKSAGVIVLVIDGWATSEGVQDEIRLARRLGKPVWALIPGAGGFELAQGVEL